MTTLWDSRMIGIRRSSDRGPNMIVWPRREVCRPFKQLIGSDQGDASGGLYVQFLKQMLWLDPGTTRRPARPLESLDDSLLTIEQAETIDGAFQCLLDHVPGDRFPYVALTRITPRHRPVASTFPLSWAAEYMGEAYEIGRASCRE